MACRLVFVAAERLCYVDSPVAPPLHCLWVDVARSAIEVSRDELFKMLVNFLLLISFLDERFVQVCRRFNEEFRFGADLTVPVQLTSDAAIFASCCYFGQDMWELVDFQSFDDQLLLLVIQFGLPMRAIMPYRHVEVVHLFASDFRFLHW